MVNVVVALVGVLLVVGFLLDFVVVSDVVMVRVCGQFG